MYNVRIFFLNLDLSKNKMPLNKPIYKEIIKIIPNLDQTIS